VARDWGSKFWGLEHGVWGIDFKVSGFGCLGRIRGSGIEFGILEFRDQGSG